MPRKKKDKSEEKPQVEEQVVEDEAIDEEQELIDTLAGEGKSIIVLPPMMGGSEQQKKIRVIPVIGDVGERMSLEVTYELLSMRESGLKKVLSDIPSDPNSEIIEKYMPIEMVISTYGGSALDMFGICDMMRVIKEDCPIITTGIGKVMSAGVLILASGTKGARRIGRNTRVMIHSVIGGTHGSMHNLENEIEEIRWIQDRYIDTLVKETDMTKRMVKKLLDKKVNIYLDAEQAVDYGIADIIV